MFALAAAIAMLPVILGGDLRTFWDRTIAFQRDRGSPFSIWGLWGGLDTAADRRADRRRAARGRGRVRAAAPRPASDWPRCGGAVLIALQLGVTHWFYLYIVWFFPLVMVALLGRYGDPEAQSRDAEARAVAGSAEAGRGGHEQLLDRRRRAGAREHARITTRVQPRVVLGGLEAHRHLGAPAPRSPARA